MIFGALAVALSALQLMGAEPNSSKQKVGSAKPVDATVVGEEPAVLTQAPRVPPPIKRSQPTKVLVKLEVREVVKRMADGVEYLFWTF